MIIDIHNTLASMNITYTHNTSKQNHSLRINLANMYLPQPCENGGREEGAAPGTNPPPEFI